MKKQVWQVLNDLKGGNATKGQIAYWLFANRIQPYALLIHDKLGKVDIGSNMLDLENGKDLPQALIELINQKPEIEQNEINTFLETEIEVNE